MKEWTRGKLGLGGVCLGRSFAEEHLVVLLVNRLWQQRWPTVSWAVLAAAQPAA